MKKIFAFIGLLACMQANAQFNNEWIDYAKTYYKFKVGETGLYRIPSTTLNTIGLGNTPVEQFQLWRNGVQVPIYTSVATGPIGAGFIEFWGLQNDGLPDKALYPLPTLQLNDQVSLQTDTAAYFLTVNTNTAANLRIIATANNVAGNTLPVQTWFWHSYRKNFTENINPGFAGVVATDYVRSSTYDVGEGFSTNEMYSQVEKRDTISNLYVFAAGPASTAKFVGAGTALNIRTAQMTLTNGAQSDVVVSTNFDSFNTFEASKNNVNNNALTGAQIYAILKNNNSVLAAPNDRVVVSYYQIDYPRQYNFGGANKFAFTLPASNTGYYLEINNFSFSAVAPVLYDLTNRKRLVCDLNGTTVRVVVPASTTDMKLVLASQATTAVKNVTAINAKTFVNYSQAANQGDYMIISNALLGTGAGSAVDQYRAYRSSVAGSSFNAKVFDIDQLVDQFAFGIKKHPLSVKNFVRYARQNFAVPPKYVLLMGHGMSYDNYRVFENDPNAELLNLIPTWGWPASDQLFVSTGYQALPEIPIGRLSVVNGQEIIDYLNKVKEYDLAQKNPVQDIANKRWMKNVVHVVGANDANLDILLGGYMDNYKVIAQDTSWGTSVTTFNKTNTGIATTIQNQILENLFSEGISLLTYYGHSSATALDFNLDDPNRYFNPGKYPVMSVNGCNAGDFFKFDVARLTQKNTISEKFVLAPNRGAIAFIASTHFGLVNWLNYYITGMYQATSKSKYNQPFAFALREAINGLYAQQGTDQYWARLHAEETTLHGDPFLKFNQFAIPDYDIEEAQIITSPNYISIADSNFKVKVYVHNLGQAKRDSLKVSINRELSDGSQQILFNRKIRPVYYKDSIELVVPIDANSDRGPGKIIVTLDPDNNLTEITKTNNNSSKAFVIYTDECRPVYPYNLSIMSQQNFTLYSSTADPLATTSTYLMEMDTTEFFNSPFKITRNVTSIGGLLAFSPGITYADSVVYYWRTALQKSNPADIRWSTASFVYLANPQNGNYGYNQSHFFQHKKSEEQQLALDSFRRVWNFKTKLNNLFIVSSICGYSLSCFDVDFSIAVNNDNSKIRSASVGSSIIFNVWNDVTFEGWYNAPGGSLGRFRSNMDATGTQVPVYGTASNPIREYNFEYSYRSPISRKAAMDFMDSIPDGWYVTVRPIIDAPFDTWAADWRADTALYGSGKSLYHKLKNAGFALVDSFNRLRTWSFVYRKNRPAPVFQPVFKFSDNAYDAVRLSVDCPTPDTAGSIVSPKFGPARSWKRAYWDGKNIETVNNNFDKATIDIIGVRANGTEVLIDRVNALALSNYDLSTVNVAQFPYMKLRLNAADSRVGTPYQLRYWRIYYDPVPEGALASSILLSGKDTLDLGEPLDFGIAFKNISGVNFTDSMQVTMRLTNQSNNITNIPITKKKILATNDTLTIRQQINTSNLGGNNILFVDVNPSFAQPEQTRFNNFLYKQFYVKPDIHNPVMDVVFDGVHILNQDIVSSKPLIVIKTKDESKFMLLNDTSLFSVQLRFPDGVLHPYKFGTDSLKLIPPSGTDNTATIEFKPTLYQDASGDADTYELIATAKDKSGNTAGNVEYRVRFRVINKSLISNVFNYPNPFTTSTAFVFTLTGGQVPENIRIQILTITGKIVKEITMQELGPIRIGRNITDYKWDGTDQFGNKLANGVYLYRVLTSLNGQSMDLLNISGGKETANPRKNETGKYFESGYGKMYLMR
jgi:Peptidase family C25